MSATLELVLDASGMQRGAQQATKALDDVSAKAGTAATAVVNTGKSLSSAFQASGGTIQVAGGIAQAAKAFGELNLAAGAFSASRTLLEIGKTVQDFREMRGAVGATGGAFSVLGGILRAHPLLAIASVVSLAATAMSMFGGATSKTSEAFDNLARSMREANAINATNSLLGLGGADDRLGKLRAAIQGTYAPDAQPLNATQLGGLGIGSQMDALRFIAAQGKETSGYRRFWANENLPFGGNQALEYLKTGYYTVPADIGPQGGFVTPAQRRKEFPNLSMSPEMQRSYFAGIYGQISAEDRDSAGLYQFGADRGPVVRGAQPASWGNFPQGPSNYVEQSAEQQRQVADENRRRQEESVARIAAMFEGIGQTIGSVAADLVMGSTTFRQAINSLAQSFLRQGLQSAGGAIFSSFGATATQTRGSNGGAGGIA